MRIECKKEDLSHILQNKNYKRPGETKVGDVGNDSIVEIPRKKELVLKKHVGLIHCENKLSLLQRKICNILLFNALDTITQEIHILSIRQLCSLIGYKSNDVSLIKESLKRLMSIVMEWNLLEDSKFLNNNDLPTEAISWHASTLLAGASIEKGTLRYSYSPQIKMVISSLEIYGRINLFIQAKFNSSYALVLYENCVRFKNIGKTSWFSLELFRALMGISSEKYVIFKELKRNVITPAISEINIKSDISVEIEYKKIGRQIASLRFLIKDNENYKPQFKRLKSSAAFSNHEIRLISTLYEVLQSEFNLQEKQIDKILKTHDSTYISSKINYVRKQNPKNKTAYLISALNNDYKSSKVTQPSDTGEPETPNHTLRECQEPSKISSYRLKYMQYKFELYKSWVEKNSNRKIFLDFQEQVIDKSEFLSVLYKRKGLDSAFIVAAFIEFLEKDYTDNGLPLCLSIEDYVTSEEEYCIPLNKNQDFEK